MQPQPWSAFASSLLSRAGALATLPEKLTKLGVSSADQAVALLEDDVEGTVSDLYVDEVVTSADLETLKSTVEALRRTAFAGKRRRRDIDQRTDDLLYCLELDKAKHAVERNMFRVTHPSTLSSDSVGPQGEGWGYLCVSYESRGLGRRLAVRSPWRRRTTETTLEGPVAR